MANPGLLRENAARCFRLARWVLDDEMVSKLIELGKTWEAEAECLETSLGRDMVLDRQD